MKKIKDLIPRYAILPFIIALVFQFGSFYLTRLFTSEATHYNLTTIVDKVVPFCPFFILFYFLAYVQWVAGYILISRESREACYRFFSADILSKFISAVIFIVFPTIMTRPEITGDGLWVFLTRFIYNVDTPDNLFPSLHCLVSWLCVRQAFAMKKVGKWYRIVQIVLTLAVFACVLFVKQHLFVDVISGVAVAEIGIFVSDKLQLSRLLDKLNRKVWHGREDMLSEKVNEDIPEKKEEYESDRSI